MNKKIPPMVSLDTTQGIMLASDRALAYVRALQLPPEQGLELVLECLRELEPNASIAEAMSKLRGLLAKRGLGLNNIFRPETCQASFPPMERSCMISEGLDVSIIHIIGKILTKGVKPFKKLI